MFENQFLRMNYKKTEEIAHSWISKLVVKILDKIKIFFSASHFHFSLR